MELDPHVIDFARKMLDEYDTQLNQLQNEWADINQRRNALMVLFGEQLTGRTDPTSATDGGNAQQQNDASDPTEVTRRVISGMGDVGFAPKDITARVTAMGVILGSGFVSNLLFRMKKRGEVIEREGKYYLPRFPHLERLAAGEAQGLKAFGRPKGLPTCPLCRNKPLERREQRRTLVQYGKTASSLHMSEGQFRRNHPYEGLCFHRKRSSLNRDTLI